MQIADLATATPAEIDTVLAEIDGRAWAAHQTLASAEQSVVSASTRSYRDRPSLKDAEAALAARVADEALMVHERRSAARALDRLAEARAAIAALDAEAAPYNAEYRRRPWSRVFVALTSGRGHAHRGLVGCPSLHRGQYMTRMGWQPHLSGASLEQILDEAGSDACSICYRGAPIRAGRARSIFHPDEVAAAAAREQRAAEKAARAAAKAAKAITTPDGKILKDPSGWEIKTVVTAWNEAVAAIFNHRAYGYPDHADAIDRIVAALAAKLGQTTDEIRAQVETKVTAKARREKVTLRAA